MLNCQRLIKTCFLTTITGVRLSYKKPTFLQVARLTNQKFMDIYVFLDKIYQVVMFCNGINRYPS